MFTRGAPGRSATTATTASSPFPAPGSRIHKQKFMPANVPADLDAVVIGSGMGGLAAASILSSTGKRVLVLEQAGKIGGCLHVFKSGGYEFDTGLHYVSGVSGGDLSLRKVVALMTDDQIDWASTSESTFDVARFGVLPAEDQGEQVSPTARSGFQVGMVPDVADAQAASGGVKLHAALKLLPLWIATRLQSLLPFTRYSNQTTAQVLATCGCSEALAGVLAYIWGDYGLPPRQSSFAIHALVVSHYFNGGHYPVGGPGLICRQTVAALERRGSRAFVRATVDEILLDHSGTHAVGVRVNGHHVVKAKLVVSAVGAHGTFTRLLPPSCAPVQAIARALTTQPALVPSVSMLSLFVGLDADQEALQLPSNNVWAFPSTAHDANWDAFEHDMQADFPAMFISCPSAKDPDWATRHPGQSVLLVLVPAFYEPFKQWADGKPRKRGADYDQLKAGLTQRMLAKLVEHLPQVEGHIAMTDLGTPLSNTTFLGAAKGEVYGMAHTPTRFQLPWLRPTSPIQGLYLSGQDIVTDGVLGAAIGGVLCAIGVGFHSLFTGGWRAIVQAIKLLL